MMVVEFGEDKKELGAQISRDCYERMRQLYGEDLPEMVEKRGRSELNIIEMCGIERYFVLGRMVADKSRELGYPVSFRGTLGSSFVAYLLGITDINPLEAHYVCESCHAFKCINGENDFWLVGPDLSNEHCPVCQKKLKKDGFNIPFTSFVIPDRRWLNIVINVASDIYYQIVSFIRREFGRITVFHSLDDLDRDGEGKIVFEIISDPTLSMLHSLETETGVPHDKIPLDEMDVLKLFGGSSDIGWGMDCAVGQGYCGAIGINGYSSRKFQKILSIANPNSFSDLARVSALGYGGKCWTKKTKIYVASGVVDLSELVSYRDDILLYLESKGLFEEDTYRILEQARFGKGLTEDDEKLLLYHGIPGWYVDSLKSVRYLFPKAHSYEHALRSWQLAYYKLYHPKSFYRIYLKYNRQERITDEIYVDPERLNKLIYETKDRLKKEDLAIRTMPFSAEEELNALYILAEARARGFDIEELLAG